MRTIKQLLQLMLDNKQMFQYGLCGLSWSILSNNLITREEYRLLTKYIHDNKPFTLHDFFVNDNFYWKRGNIKPRIKWLKHHISIN